MEGVVSSVPLLPVPQPRLELKLTASSRISSLGRSERRRGTQNHAKAASAGAATRFQECSSRALVVVVVVGAIVAAVVVICSVVLPPPVSESGLKEQVASALPGGVQPKV